MKSYFSILKLSLLVSLSHVSVKPITLIGFPCEFRRCLNESKFLDTLLIFKCKKEK